MKCGQCGNPLQVAVGVLPNGAPPVVAFRSCAVAFRTGKGVDITVHFCSLNCVFHGGAKYMRSLNPGAATTKRTFKQLYPGAVE